MTIDGYMTPEEATEIYYAIAPLNFQEIDLGREVQNFELVPPDADDIFSKVLNKRVSVQQENSGVFRFPSLFIHFDDFKTPDDWLFVVALQDTTFNLFEHKSGAVSALEGYEFQYRNLFEWDLTVNYLLKPGQGIFFRPWLFHSFDGGLIQMFRLKEIHDAEVADEG